MAKKSMINRENKRTKLVRKYAQNLLDAHDGRRGSCGGSLEHSGKRNVALVTWSERRNVCLQAATKQGEVAQQVHRLVAHELVGPAQLATSEPILREDDGVVELDTLDEPSCTQIRRGPGPQALLPAASR